MNEVISVSVEFGEHLKDIKKEENFSIPLKEFKTLIESAGEIKEKMVSFAEKNPSTIKSLIEEKDMEIEQGSPKI